LNLAGITALLIGGIGIGNAVAFHVAGRTEAIATLKCLGAATGLVFAACLLQILAMALAGIAIGLGLGALAPLLAGKPLAGLLPAAGHLAPFLRSTLGYLLGACTAFALAPVCLARRRRRSPG
jgi:putative ABC transport system permease protein